MTGKTASKPGNMQNNVSYGFLGLNKVMSKLEELK